MISCMVAVYDLRMITARALCMPRKSLDVTLGAVFIITMSAALQGSTYTWQVDFFHLVE